MDEDSSSSSSSCVETNRSTPARKTLRRAKLFDSNGNTPLILAAQSGNYNAVVVLTEKYRLPVNHQNLDNECALSLASIHGNAQIVSYLVDHGANVNITNARGETPLHAACALGYLEIVRLLVQEGSWLEAEDEAGDTALHFAVREEHGQVIEFLLLSGADPDHCNEDNESPLMLAELVASPAVFNLFSICGACADGAAAIVQDGNANGALEASCEMKLDLTKDSMELRKSFLDSDNELDGRCAGSLLGSGSVYCPVASAHIMTKLHKNFISSSIPFRNAVNTSTL
jgi:hypothetical protein